MLLITEKEINLMLDKVLLILFNPFQYSYIETKKIIFNFNFYDYLVFIKSESYAEFINQFNLNENNLNWLFNYYIKKFYTKEEKDRKKVSVPPPAFNLYFLACYKQNTEKIINKLKDIVLKKMKYFKEENQENNLSIIKRMLIENTFIAENHIEDLLDEKEALMYLVNRKNLSSKWIEIIIKSGDYKTKVELIKNFADKLTEKQLIELAKNKSIKVKQELANTKRKLPQKAINLLLKEEKNQIIFNILNQQELNEEQLKFLLNKEGISSKIKKIVLNKINGIYC